MLIDTHCHLDAAEFDGDRVAVIDAARLAGVGGFLVPAVGTMNFDGVAALTAANPDCRHAFGIHPMYVAQAREAHLDVLRQRLTNGSAVAVGEIGLDFFVPALCEPAMRERQLYFYRAQLRLAQRYGLPVILHVRRSADALLKPLRELAGQGRPVLCGIAHAFNGSVQQAQAFVALGFRLGFGGAVTFEAARRLRQLATELPLDALVLETDAPDIPPQWLYVDAAARAAGQPQGVNTPAELPRIGAVVAGLRGMAPAALAAATTANARAALPRLAALQPAGAST